MNPRIPIGLRFMAYGAFWFSAMAMFVKLAGQRLPSMQIVLVRAVITLILSWALLRRERLNPWTGRSTLLILRGLLGAIALTCFYFSLVHLPLAEATVIQYMNPLLISILAAVFIGERPRTIEWVGVVISLAGVILIARPAFLFGDTAHALRPLYVVIATMGALFSSLAYITVRQLRHEHHPLVVVFFFPLVTIPLALPAAIPGWIRPTAIEWVLMICVGITTQIGQVYITRGLQMERATRASAVGYLQIVFAALWGALVFGQFPDGWSLLGAVVIAASTLGVVLAGKSEEPATRQEPA